MRIIGFAVFCILIAQLVAGCTLHAESRKENGTPISTPTPVVTVTPNTKPSEKLSDLCKQLPEIKQFPDRDPSEEKDPIYAAVVSKGKKILPCLVDQITNDTPMHDPRPAPVWQHYKVGDTAVFILARLDSDPEILEKMLPSPFREEWETNGVYAYFNYVSKAANRRNLQTWWRSHLEKK